MKCKLLFCMLFCCIFSLKSFSQTKTITGTVQDEKGSSLPGATVNATGSTTSVKTDVNGKFSITVPANAKTLSFSFVGMENQQASVSKNNVVNVTLKLFSASLGEVVVVGYGTAKKANVSSSISSISEKDIRNLPVAGADQMLQGKVAGVSVTTNSGQPGGGVSVRVRGITSVNGNEPLYVIDGVPILSGSTSISQDQLGGVPGQNRQSVLATINPSDIASIDILKDAAAQGIYGAQGANGVVLITTKKGKSGAGKISYDVYYGIQQVQKTLPLMNLREYATYYNGIVGEGTVSGLDSIGEFRNPAILGKGTNWQNAVFQNAQVVNHQISFSGGADKTTYYMSGNYYSQEGTVIGSGFKRYSLRASIDQQVRSWLKAGISSNASKTNQKITLTDGNSSVIALALYNSPATPVKDFNGDYLTTTNISGVPFGNASNPVALALLRNVQAVQTKVFGNLYADLQITKSISFRNQFNYDYQLSQNSAFQPSIRYPNGVTLINPSRLREDRGNGLYLGLQSFATYNHNFGKHYVNVVVGHEAQSSTYDATNVSVVNLTQNIQSVNAGTLDPAQTGGGKYHWSAEGYFARLNYAYDNRYSLNVSVRRDGSASFGPQKRIGYFPAASVGWTVTNEKFAKNIKGIDYLKLRLGAGAVGNSNTSGSALYTTNIRLIPNINGLFGQTGVAGVPANAGNPLLSWEAVKTYNGGIDITTLKKKIEITIDVYKKVTTNMLLSTKLPVFAGLDPNPPNNSYQEVEPPTTNAGQMTNTGFDLSITSYNMQKKNFSWKTTVIFSRYKNVLDKLNSENATLIGRSADFNPQILTITKAGEPVGQFFGFVTDGLYRTAAELSSGPTPELAVSPTGTWLGDIRYKDLNGDGKIDSQDQTYIGNPNPKFTYGVTNTFKYKNFDLSILLTGVQGNKIFNYTRLLTEANYNVYQNQLKTALDHYSATNTGSNFPRYNQWNQNNLKISDRFVEDGSYLRIQNVSLAYSVPAKWISKVKMSTARIYISAQNLYTITNYTGLDPEIGSFNSDITRMNVDYGHYPTPRTFTLGANIEF